MGCILDSSIIVTAERRRFSAVKLFQEIEQRIGSQDLALSAVGYTELMIGLHRDRDPQRFAARQRFFVDLLATVPVTPYSLEIAETAGRLGAQGAFAGLTIPFADLMIGATAVSMKFSVLTFNLRHFRLVPGLEVLTL